MAKHDRWLHRRTKTWLGKKHGKASGATLRRLYAKRKDGERKDWQMGGKKITLFSEAKRMLFPERGRRMPNGWNATLGEQFLKGADKFWEATGALAKL